MAVYREKVALRRLFLRIFALHIGGHVNNSTLPPVSTAASRYSSLPLRVFLVYSALQTKLADQPLQHECLLFQRLCGMG